jgi:16S rRNA (guanine(966)-N(2))-methyltransferase RsmD
VRIIAGDFRGHPLVAPRGSATRPTSDRVREALFSILGDVAGLDVLDLYAGSGALGLEALSRGARHATFVENAHAAVTALKRNIAELGLAERAHVVATGVERAVNKAYDPKLGLVFLDPPYARAGVADVIARLDGSGALLDGAWIVLEHAARTEPPAAAANCELRFTRTYGDTALTFYRHQSREAE